MNHAMDFLSKSQKIFCQLYKDHELHFKNFCNNLKLIEIATVIKMLLLKSCLICKNISFVAVY